MTELKPSGVETKTRKVGNLRATIENPKNSENRDRTSGGWGSRPA